MKLQEPIDKTVAEYMQHANLKIFVSNIDIVRNSAINTKAIVGFLETLLYKVEVNPRTRTHIHTQNITIFKLRCVPHSNQKC